MDTIYISQVDTIFINTVPQDLINHYTNILEKTNEQLGLWSNPSVLAVSFLGVLFTAMAIVAAIIIFRQQSEQKRTIKNMKKFFDDEITKGKTLLNDLLQQYKDQLNENKKQIDNNLNEYEKLLGKITNTEWKNEIQENVTTLQKKKEQIETEIENPFFSFSKEKAQMIMSYLIIRCEGCGHKYQILNPFNYLSNIGLMSEPDPNREHISECPICSCKNKISDNRYNF